MEFPPSGSFRRKKNRAHSFICVVYQLSFLSLYLSLSLLLSFPSCYASFTVHRCGLFSVQVVCVCRWMCVCMHACEVWSPPLRCPSPLQSPVWPVHPISTHYFYLCKTLNWYQTHSSAAALFWHLSPLILSSALWPFFLPVHVSKSTYSKCTTHTHPHTQTACEVTGYVEAAISLHTCMSIEWTPVFVLQIASIRFPIQRTRWQDFTSLETHILQLDYFLTGYFCLTHVYMCVTLCLS